MSVEKARRHSSWPSLTPDPVDGVLLGEDGHPADDERLDHDPLLLSGRGQLTCQAT